MVKKQLKSEEISNQKLEKLIRSQNKVIARLSLDIDRKGSLMGKWVENRQLWTDKINKDLLEKSKNHDKEIDELKQHHEIDLKFLRGEYDKAIEVNRELSKVNDDCIKKNTEILKSHNDITRAYNGLHTLGKFAEETGIDIKDHTKMLPENDAYEFHQKHTLLESGKVKHSWTAKKKKEDK